MDCCVNALGRFAHNKEILTGVVAVQAGNHSLFMQAPTGGSFNLDYTLEIGDEIVIPIGQLNESMSYKFKIEQPDGTFLQVDSCENFSLTTIINTTPPNGCNDTCDDVPAYYGI